MRIISTFFLTLITLSFITSHDALAAYAGDSCTDTEFGTTKMEDGGASLIACMREQSNGTTYIWKSMMGDSTPSGIVAYFNLSACPDGWSAANGNNGTIDVRGYFLRSLDSGRGIDSGRSLGSTQGDAIRNITGTIYAHENKFGGASGVFSKKNTASWRSRGGNISHDTNFTTAVFNASKQVPTASENRPKNIALLACQKD